jgi:DNA polymerase-3 subunit epsilon
VIIAGIDTETTGLFTPDNRIIEVYAGLWDLDTKTLIKAMDQRVNPERPIAPAAQAVHGIANSDLVYKPTWDTVGPELAEFLKDADLIVGHNAEEFDLPFINMEQDRIKASKIVTPVFDTMLRARWSTFNGKVPNLGELCWACGVEYDTTKAHAASYDVEITMQCFFLGMKWGFYNPPEIIAARAAKLEDAVAKAA